MSDPGARPRSGRPWLALAAVLAVAVLVALALRTTVLYWSPYPPVQDGIRYAALARETVATGALPTPIDHDELTFTALLAGVSALSGVPAIRAAQPLAAVLGALSVLVGGAVAHRIGIDLGWSPGRARAAAGLAALGLALDGIYARRTGVPDEEVLGLLVVPALVFCAHAALETRGRTRHGWLAAAVVLLVALPPTHSLTALVGGLSLTALACLHVRRRTDLATVGVALALAGGVWLTIGGWYWVARVTPGLRILFVDRVLGAPGLFLAWVVALAVAIVWYARLSTRARTGLLAVALGVPFALAAVNLLGPVFPGTLTTPPATLAMAFGLALPAVLAARAGGWALDGRRRWGWVAVTAVAGTLAMVGYALSAGLTFEFFGTALRTQTYAHVGVVVLAALAVAAVGARDRSRSATAGSEESGRATGRLLRWGLAVALVVSVAASAPLAIVALDTLSLPATVTPAEFEAAGYATATGEPWTSEGSITSLARYYGGTATAGPVDGWARGQAAPPCPVLAERSWTTVGLHRYPLSPIVVEPDRLDRLVAGRDVLYASTGVERVYVLDPVGEAAGCVANRTVESGP